MSDVDYWSELKAYLPVFVVLVSAVIAFITSIRHKDRDRYYKSAEDNLYKLIEPMYFQLINIKNIRDERHKVELIRKFFNSYNPETINISKLGNRKLVNRFIETHEAFIHYQIEFDDKRLKLLSRKIGSLEYLLEKEYWKLFEAVYKDYKYFKKTAGMNYLFRFFYRISIFIKSTFFAVSWIIVFFMLFVILDEYRGKTIWVEDLKEKLLFLLLCLIFSLIMLSMSVIINLAIADDTKQKKTISDYLTLGITSLWKKGAMKRRERKKETAIRKEQRARAASIEESD